MEGFASVRENLLSVQKNADEALPYDVMVWTKQRAWDALDFLMNCYSAGHPIEELAEIFPAILEDWREYARRSMNLVELGDDSGSAAHIPLLDWEFSFANQLVCFDILFHDGRDLRDISEIIDFNNTGRDGMLERLMSPFLSGRAAPPDECIRHLPYFKTLKIFDATPAARPALMAGYLDGWYVASRREVYYESHKRKTGSVGTGRGKRLQLHISSISTTAPIVMPNSIRLIWSNMPAALVHRVPKRCNLMSGSSASNQVRFARRAELGKPWTFRCKDIASKRAT